jgi:dephospho-CoA kinase
MPETRENLTTVGTELRIKHGAGVLGERTARTFRPDQNYVVDSIRHPAEVAALRAAGNFSLIAVTCSPEQRYHRLIARHRTGDLQSLDEFLRADALEQAHPDPAGQQIRATAALADHSLANDGARADFEAAAEALAERLAGRALPAV